MASNEQLSQARPATWSPTNGAVHVECLKPDILMVLRHPTHPFTGSIDPRKDLPKQARAIAHGYLEAARDALQSETADALEAILEALRPDKAEPNRARQQGIGWLDIAWGEKNSAQPDPRLSFWVSRHHKDTVIDRTLVLCAGYRNNGLSQNGEKGLKVVMHVDAQEDRKGQWPVRITGLSISLPEVSAALINNQREKVEQLGLQKTLDWLAAGLPFGSPALGGYSLVETTKETMLQFFANSSSIREPGDAPTRSYSLVAEVTKREDGELEIRNLSVHERTTHGLSAPGEVFPRDPSSVGSANTVLKRGPAAPFSREDVLDSLRKQDGRLPIPQQSPGKRPPPVALEYSNNQGTKLLEIRQSALEGGDRRKTRKQRRRFFSLRSDDLAAEHAFVRGRDLFDRLSAYGFEATEYFRMAKLPLIIRHRAGIIPGARDGETINAQVRLLGDGLAWNEPYDENKRSEIEVRFAAADLSHRRKSLDAAGRRRRAQYLGLAADPRWAWHEFGHVLNAAATGELELRFAHSVGDALAAVALDPESDIAAPRSAASRHHWRGVTFPWVALNRRHDREADRGWSFSSRRYRETIRNSLALGPSYRAYFAEQLMSSAIFRLYRIIGGDSDDAAMRCSSADYVVYLLIRAIALLGAQSLVPARTADHFVSALIDADIGTGIWNVQTAWNTDPAAKSAYRVGGCVHKVIRWAFEQQGLYEDEAPAVDVFVADRRPGGGDGGYQPVPLNWDKLATQPWHAHDGAIAWDGNALTVSVGNRGAHAATGVNVHVWQRRIDEPDKPWDCLAPAAGQPAALTVPAKGQSALRFQAGQSVKNRDYYVVAAATCAADRANFDPATGLPCANNLTPLIDLIANDNNVGLRVLRFD